MGVEAALPSSIRKAFGSLLTFIVPAPNGCNLACPFCYIRQRREDEAVRNLTPDDYGRFIREVAERQSIAAVCIQGYEPLLDASFAYTRSILATGRWLGSADQLDLKRNKFIKMGRRTCDPGAGSAVG